MRIGLFGGSFDPVHQGHLLAAEGAQKALNLDRVLWIVSGIPPHKGPPSRVSPEDRFNLVTLAIQGNPHFEVSRVELDSPSPSYTIDTVRRLQAQGAPAAQWFFLIGSDNARELACWKSFDQLKTLVRFAVIPRPDLPGAAYPEGVEEIPVKTLAVSSSQIRQRIEKGLSIQGLVPEAVARYIQARGLYR